MQTNKWAHSGPIVAVAIALIAFIALIASHPVANAPNAPNNVAYHHAVQVADYANTSSINAAANMAQTTTAVAPQQVARQEVSYGTEHVQVANGHIAINDSQNAAAITGSTFTASAGGFDVAFPNNTTTAAINHNQTTLNVTAFDATANPGREVVGFGAQLAHVNANVLSIISS